MRNRLAGAHAAASKAAGPHKQGCSALGGSPHKTPNLHTSGRACRTSVGIRAPKVHVAAAVPLTPSSHRTVVHLVGAGSAAMYSRCSRICSSVERHARWRSTGSSRRKNLVVDRPEIARPGAA